MSLNLAIQSKSLATRLGFSLSRRSLHSQLNFDQRPVLLHPRRRISEVKLNLSDAAEAVANIKSGQRVFVHGVAATPKYLLDTLLARHKELQNVELCHLHLEYNPHADAKYSGSFRANNLFTGAGMRKPVNEGRADYIPAFLSEIPLFFDRGVVPLDAALLTISEPDENGFASLGTSVDVAYSALRNTKLAIGQINKSMPRTRGHSVHVSQFDYLIEKDEKLPEMKGEAAEGDDAMMDKIGKNIASLVDDGATLQMGIGRIPDAALKNMTNHKDLGIHTEMFSDGLLNLVESGVVSNKYKSFMPGYIITSFMLGSRKLYDYVDRNDLVRFLPCDVVNDPAIIKTNQKVIAINSGIEVDVTGQVCADSIGTNIYSGVGGQLDFERGAALSPGGRAIIALKSTTSKGESRIVRFLRQGAGVVTTRAHVHYVITENGIAHLHGKNLRQRARAMIDIANPKHQEALEKEAHTILKCM